MQIRAIRGENSAGKKEAAVSDRGSSRDAAQLRKPSRGGRRGYRFPVSSFDDAGEMDVQLNANVEEEDRAKSGKDEAGGMKSSGYRVRKHVGDRAADDRSDDAEDDCPKNRHVHVHNRFRDNPRD